MSDNDYVDECDKAWEAREAHAAMRDAMIEDYIRNMDASEIEEVIKFDADIIANIIDINRKDEKQMVRIIGVQIKLSIENWAERAVDERMGWA